MSKSQVQTRRVVGDLHHILTRATRPSESAFLFTLLQINKNHKQNRSLKTKTTHYHFQKMFDRNSFYSPPQSTQVAISFTLNHIDSIGSSHERQFTVFIIYYLSDKENPKPYGKLKCFRNYRNKLFHCLVLSRRCLR
jgi:hypothetical protein